MVSSSAASLTAGPNGAGRMRRRKPITREGYVLAASGPPGSSRRPPLCSKNAATQSARRVQQRSASVIVEIAEPEAGSSSTAGPGHNWSRAALACHVSRGPRRQRGSWVNASITAADAHDSGEALADVFGQLDRK